MDRVTEWMAHVRFWGGVGILCLIPFVAWAPGAILLTWDFEGGDPFHHLALEGEDPVVVPDPANPKNRVMKSVLRVDSARSGRSEVRWDNIKPGQERWVGAKILVSETNPKEQCLFQLGPVNYLQSKVQGTGYFQVLRGEGSRNWVLRGYLERVSLPDRKLPRVKVDGGPIAVGAWQTFVIHSKVSTGEDGILEFWVGDRKVYELKGPNCTVMPYIVPVKWGIYIGEGGKMPEDGTAYFDNVVLADETSNYEEIMAALGK